MNISYNWLKEYLKVDATLTEVVETLTSIGLEVEGLERIEAIRGGLEGVVVGEVISCEEHPDSDHLHITSINIGAGENLGIVCGAANVAKGQKVAVATIGTMLYPTGAEEGFKIKRSKIRGVESLGMICAEDELGIGNDHAGIMVLSDEAVVGTPLKEYLEESSKYKVSDDYCIAIGLTPNRIDAASHYGVARDLAAYFKAHKRDAEVVLPKLSMSSEQLVAQNNIEVKVEDTEGAPRYAGITIDGVEVADSPEWLQERLRSIGLNPHNNVVDVTNFVLHELCQPLHSFDADKIEGNRVVVRTCETGTKFITLDGVERTLSGEEVMICDDTKPMCIAGVMGGQDSSVSKTTKRIFLESAYFNPVRIRKAARKHGLNTDASFRFERGIDPNITIFALKRAAELICQITGGHITSDIIDIYPTPIEDFRFDISLNRINSLLGKELERCMVENILTALQIRIEAYRGDDILSIAVPPYRVDVQGEADIAEEVLRIYGYNNIEFPSQVRSSLAYCEHIDKEWLTNKISNMLSFNGFNEIMSNSLSKLSYYEGLTSYPSENCVKLLNPLSTDLNAMRQTLLFNAMEAVSLNINHRRSDLKLFEFGNVYRYNTNDAENPLSKYSEKYRLGIAITGNWNKESWNETGIKSNFFHLKATIERILRLIGTDLYSLKCETLQNDLFSEGMVLKSGERIVATIGIVSQKVKSLTDVKAEVYYAELEVETLLRLAKKANTQVKELPRFPEVRRDLALLVDKGTNFAILREIAFSTEKKLLKSVSLFDVYEGDKLPEGKKSYAISFSLQDLTQTLTEQQIERVMANLVKHYKERVGAEIRNN